MHFTWPKAFKRPWVKSAKDLNFRLCFQTKLNYGSDLLNTYILQKVQQQKLATSQLIKSVNIESSLTFVFLGYFEKKPIF